MQRRPRFTHAATEDLYRYWDRRRGGRSAPDRTEIEPGDIRAILPDTFILEVDEADGYTWRLAGTRVCALHCRELKGRDFLSDWDGKERATLHSLLDAVVRESAVGVLQLEAKTERGQVLELEMVLLPLKVFGRANCRVLGAIAALDQPYWLGVTPPRERRIAGMRMVFPATAPAEPDAIERRPQAAPLVPAGPEPPVTALASIERVRRYRHLMVVDGGKV